MERSGKFIRRVRVYLLSAALLENVLRWLLTCWCLFLIWGVGDFVLQLPIAWRRGFYYAAALAGIAFAARFVAAARPAHHSDEKIIRAAQRAAGDVSDEFLSAWQLHRAVPRGISAALVAELVRAAEKRFADMPISAVVPVADKAKRAAAAGCALFCITAVLYALPPRLLPPAWGRIFGALSRTEWSSYFMIDPGTRSFPQASRVEILLQRKRGFAGEPSLYLRQAGAPWRREELTRYSPGRLGYTVGQLTSAIEYYVVWGDWRTPVFTLTPALFPQAGDFSATYYFPSYTALTPRTVKDAPHLVALAGTRVEVAARTNNAIREGCVLTEEGKRYPLTIDRTGFAVRFQMIISKNTKYRILLIDRNGIANPEPPEYDITVVDDRVPEIELVSPNADLVVAKTGELPLVIRADDDFGVAGIALVYVRGDRVGRCQISSAMPAGRRLFDYAWKLEKLDLGAGEKVRYYIEAWDNDTISGPKKAVTPSLTIETADYGKEHEKIEQALKEMRNDLLNALADQTVARNSLESLQADFSTDTWRGLVRAQEQVGKSMEKPVSELKALVERMENDPYTDFATHGEYGAMADHLSYLKDTTLSEASAALGRKDFAAARKKQDEAIACLEKMTLLSEDVWQYQRMRDILDKGTELDRIAGQLNAGAAPEDMKRALGEINDLLAQMYRQLSALSQELPEDFINAPAVKNIDMQGVQQLSGAMDKALADGDYKSAKALAAELARQLKEVTAQLQEAGKNIGFAGEGGAANVNELKQKSINLEELVSRQEKVIETTEEVDGRRRQALFRRQESMLAVLEKKQAAIIAAVGKVRPKIRAKAVFLDNRIEMPAEKMGKVREEFAQRRVYYAQKYLEDIIRKWDEVLVVAETRAKDFGELYPSIKDDGNAILAGEKEIMNALREQPKQGLLSPADETKLDALSKTQRALKNDTGALKGLLEAYMRKSARVSPEVFDSLDKSVAKMNDTADNLSVKDTPAADESGRQALEYLRRGIDGLKSSMDGMQSEKEGAGKPAGGFIQIRRGGAQAGGGARNEPVKLPAADEYKPPKEFRQEIMDALTEKYPRQYEKIIKEYFRRLAE